MQVDVSLIISVASIIIVILTFAFNTTKNTRNDAQALGEQKADLKHIKDKVDEVWADFRALGDKVEHIDRRLSTVEESTKSAHKRIDELKEKTDK